MLGQRLQKVPGWEANYSIGAAWCNENGATIVDCGNYFEIRALPERTETKEERVQKLMKKLDVIKKAHQGALLMGSDTETLMTEYRQIVEEIKAVNLEKETHVTNDT